MRIFHHHRFSYPHLFSKPAPIAIDQEAPELERNQNREAFVDAIRSATITQQNPVEEIEQVDRSDRNQRSEARQRNRERNRERRERGLRRHVLTATAILQFEGHRSVEVRSIGIIWV